MHMGVCVYGPFQCSAPPQKKKAERQSTHIHICTPFGFVLQGLKPCFVHACTCEIGALYIQNHAFLEITGASNSNARAIILGEIDVFLKIMHFSSQAR